MRRAVSVSVSIATLLATLFCLEPDAARPPSTPSAPAADATEPPDARLLFCGRRVEPPYHVRADRGAVLVNGLALRLAPTTGNAESPVDDNVRARDVQARLEALVAQVGAEVALQVLASELATESDVLAVEPVGSGALVTYAADPMPVFHELYPRVVDLAGQAATNARWLADTAREALHDGAFVVLDEGRLFVLPERRADQLLRILKNASTSVGARPELLRVLGVHIPDSALAEHVLDAWIR